MLFIFYSPLSSCTSCVCLRIEVVVARILLPPVSFAVGVLESSGSLFLFLRMKRCLAGPFIFPMCKWQPLAHRLSSFLSPSLPRPLNQTNTPPYYLDRSSSETIPVIDITGFLDGSDKISVAAKIGQACQEIGFFMIRGHGERLLGLLMFNTPPTLDGNDKSHFC